MAQIKRTRRKKEKHAQQKAAIATASLRLTGMHEISPKLDLQGGVSVDSVSKASKQLSDLLAQHDATERELVGISVNIKEQTKVLNDLNQRVLTGVSSRYGPDSKEYKLVGGVRRSEKKKPVRAPRSNGSSETAAGEAPATTTPTAAVPANGASAVTNGHSS